MMRTLIHTRPVRDESSHNNGLPIVVIVTRRRSPTRHVRRRRGFFGLALTPKANPFEKDVLLGAMAASLELSVRADLFA
eukprot:2406025-Pyramimonas_sp.AAC.1